MASWPDWSGSLRWLRFISRITWHRSAHFWQFPTLPQVACFDTAFHRTHDAVADYYAIPHQLHAEGVRVTDFTVSRTNTSRRPCHRSPRRRKGAVIVAHLGSGASMCALKKGRSAESTMGSPRSTGFPWERGRGKSTLASCCIS